MPRGLWLLLSLLALSTCATSTNVTSGNVPAEEALVVGKIQVSYNGDDVTSKIYLNFKNSGGTVFKIDNEAGFFVAHLPVGAYELRDIRFAKAFKGAFGYPFGTGRGTFEIPAVSKIYDLGCITMVWNGPTVKMSQFFVLGGAVGGLIGGLADVAQGNGALTLAVSDDSVEMSDAFLERFGSRPSMVKFPLRVTNR